MTRPRDDSDAPADPNVEHEEKGTVGDTNNARAGAGPYGGARENLTAAQEAEDGLKTGQIRSMNDDEIETSGADQTAGGEFLDDGQR